MYLAVPPLVFEPFKVSRGQRCVRKLSCHGGAVQKTSNKWNETWLVISVAQSQGWAATRKGH